MATFYELKRIIGKIFGQRDIEDNGEDISCILPNTSWRDNGQNNTSSFVIKNEELRSLYDFVTNSEKEELALYSSNQYEIIVNIDRLICRGDELIRLEDSIHNINYEFGSITIEYGIYLLILLCDTNTNDAKTGRIPFKLQRFRRLHSSRYYENETFDWKDILLQVIGEYSLKIKSSNDVKLSIWNTLKTAFEFDFMYKSGISLVNYIDISDVFRLNSDLRNRLDLSDIDSAPLRQYSNDVVDYYRLALSSNDAYIKYISFYHVIEYFFDEIFKNRLIDDLRDKITRPDFSYLKNDKLYEIALFVKNRMKMDNDNGQGNEIESLKFVLSEYISVEELINRLNDINEKSKQYYQENKVTFCNAPAIAWNDTQGVITHLAKRIYITRNSLVHSKSGKNKERYRPYKDEMTLKKEIPLVQAISELIIINSSKIMD